MISKDELVRNVAETCGISIENSTLFFDVFVNRVSSKLKPGETLNFNNLGYFQKRQCRIQLGKTSSSQTEKSYLIHLVIFSLEPKIKSDLSDIQLLRIPNLKTLWLDDEDFLKSLKAGDFAPYTERNQLIKAFATKAEVILSNQRKDYDSELEAELIIPITFDLNFLIKSSHKSVVPEIKKDESNLSKVDRVVGENKKTESKLPNSTNENIAREFGRTNQGDKTPAAAFRNLSKEEMERKNKIHEESERRKLFEKSLQSSTIEINEFETNDLDSVKSSAEPEIEEEKSQKKDYDTVKFSFNTRSFNLPEERSSDRYTEVKSKTEAYNLKDDLQKGKKKSRDDIYKSYGGRKNYVPLIIISAFIIISAAVIYFYFLKGGTSGSKTSSLNYEVKPPANTNIVERDYEYAVTYPNPKSETPAQVEGYDSKIFNPENQKPTVVNKEKPKEKVENKETTVKEKVEPQNVVAEEKSVTEKIQKETTQPELKEEVLASEQQSRRISLYRGYYVVYVGSFNSEDEVNKIADKYSNLGYNPIIQTSGVNAKGGAREYKLIVGDFTSVEFAKQFESKYLK